jgi:predicted amidohydrolase
MHIGFIQFKVAFGQKKENIERVAEFILKREADLLVLPELFNSGYLFSSFSELNALAEPVPDGQTTRTLMQLARDHRVHLVAGVPERQGNRYFNSAVLVGPQGFVGAYRKIHLFDTEKKWFQSGEEPPVVFDIGTAKIGMMICFDWIFPEVSRSLALQGAEIICHPSNLVLPYCQKAMITRCLENRVFAVTANRIGAEKTDEQLLTFTGNSQVVDPVGNVLAHAGNDERCEVAEIDPTQAQDKRLTPNNHLFADRKPNLYQI